MVNFHKDLDDHNYHHQSLYTYFFNYFPVVIEPMGRVHWSVFVRNFCLYSQHFPLSTTSFHLNIFLLFPLKLLLIGPLSLYFTHFSRKTDHHSLQDREDFSASVGQYIKRRIVRVKSYGKMAWVQTISPTDMKTKNKMWVTLPQFSFDKCSPYVYFSEKCDKCYVMQNVHTPVSWWIVPYN